MHRHCQLMRLMRLHCCALHHALCCQGHWLRPLLVHPMTFVGSGPVEVPRAWAL